MFKKVLKISIISILALLLLLAAAITGIYYYGVSRNNAIEAIGKVTLSPPNAKLGETVTATILLKCPWHRKITEAVAEPGKGSSLLDSPQISACKKIRLGYDVWEVKTELRPYRTGTIPAGKLELAYNRYNDKTKDLNGSFVIPSFKSSPLQLKKHQELAVAGELKPVKKISKQNKYMIIAIIAMLIILALILFFSRRKKSGKTIIPSWTVALNDLHHLRSDIKNGRKSLDSGFVSLTDIVRSYLEKRFIIKASKQTTEEFLNDINKNSGPLPKEQRPFLKEFMQAAELVKFAKLPPDESTLNQALVKAEDLVNQTRPQENSETDAKGGE